MPHRARRGGYRLNFSSSPKATARAVLVSFSLSLEIANADPEENGTTHSPRNPTPSLGLLTHSATASSTITHLKGRMRGGGWRRKGTFTRFSNHHHESIRRQPRGSFGSYAPLANSVTNTALSPALFAWGLRQRGVDNSVLQASLSNLESFNAISGPILLRLHVPFAPVANRSCQQRGGSGLFVRAYAAPAVDKPD